MDGNNKWRCPCCGNPVFEEKVPGSYEICSVCGWEDDKSQYEDIDLAGGANAKSLRESRRAYAMSLRETGDRRE